jgi:hypothetical protein
VIRDVMSSALDALLQAVNNASVIYHWWLVWVYKSHNHTFITHSPSLQCFIAEEHVNNIEAPECIVQQGHLSVNA